ncbi:B2 bradykinin receptor [Denticeps clupeoides]|nr:B2 bradykinin receptor-like [Denticeps clupeoides]
MMLLNGTDWAVPSPSPGPSDENCSEYEGSWRLLSSLQPAFLSLISAVGVVANSFVLAVFCLQRKPCSVPDVYLGNLAAADLVMVLCLPFWAVTTANQFHWVFGELLCKLVNVAISMNYFCSVLFLLLVSVDRYLALVRPMCPSRLRRPVWAKRVCLGIWILGFLLSLPILLFRTVASFSEYGVDACFLAYPHQAWRVQRNVTVNLVGFLVPLPVVAFCSVHIIKALKDGSVAMMPGVRTERKATQLVLVVLVVFVVCWTPYQLQRFLDTLDFFQVTAGCLWGHILDIGEQLFTYLAYSNSAVNPFLYVIVGKHFRRRAKVVFQQLLLSPRDSTSVSMSVVSKETLRTSSHLIR